ncbi:MAG: RDD family protein, partial [Gaiellaceae bacterium]
MNGAPEPESGSTEPPSAAPPGPEDLLGRRIGAALMDLVLLVAVFAILAATIGESSLEGSSFSFELDGTGAALYLGLVLVYYFALEAAIGQTVGKLLLGLRVIRADGSRPSVVAVAVRTLLRIVDWLPLF